MKPPPPFDQTNIPLATTPSGAAFPPIIPSLSYSIPILSYTNPYPYITSSQ